MATRTKGKRQAQAAYRRELLLETAYRLFAERGFRATSVRDITRAAGVTEAVLYHYFASKAALFRAVLEAYSPLAGYQQIIVENADAPVEAMLDRLGAAFLRLVRERRAFVMTLLSEAPHEPDLAGALAGTLGAAVEGVATCLAERQRRGEIAPDRDVTAAARALQGGLLVHFLTTGFAPGAGDQAAADAAVVKGLAATVWSGLRAGPAPAGGGPP